MIGPLRAIFGSRLFLRLVRPSLALLAVVLLYSLAMGVWLTQRVADEAEQDVRRSLQAAVALYQGRLSELKLAAILLSQQPAVGRALRAADLSALRETLASLPSGGPSSPRAAFYGASGKLVAASPDLLAVAATEESRRFCAAAAAVGPRAESHLHLEGHAAPVLLLRACAAVGGGGSVLLAHAMNEDASFVDDVQQRLGLSCTLFALGRRVATTHRESDGTRALAEAIPAGVGGSVLGRKLRAVVPYGTGARREIAGVEPLTDAAGRVVGALAVGRPYAPYARLRLWVIVQVSGLALAALSAFALLGYRSARSIRGRLARVVAATSEAEGTESGLVRLSDAAGDEISDLAANLRRLGERLASQRGELDRRYAQQLILSRLGRRMAAKLSASTVLGVLAEGARSLGRADLSFVLLAPEGAAGLDLWRVGGASGAARPDLWRSGAAFDDLLVRRIAETHEPVRLDDGTPDGVASARAPELASEGVVSVAAFPLLSGGGLLGAVGVGWRRAHDASDEEREALANLAGFGAVSLENARLYERIHELAIRDPVLGVFSRRHFDERMREEVKRAVRHARPLSLLVVDVDHLKRWNDRYGHAVGDLSLRGVCSAVISSVRSTDLVGRFGGDELLILMPETETGQAAVVAERLRATVQALAVTGAAESPTVSVGVATLPTHAGDVEGLFRAADRECFRAKDGGRNRVSIAA